jgi:threonine dehydratase
VKLAAMRAQGAELIEHGADFDATREHCAALAEEHGLDDFVLVSEDEIREATRLMIEHTRNLVEPAGAAPLAAALKLAGRFRGRRIALIASGGNISPAQLAALYG